MTVIADMRTSMIDSFPPLQLPAKATSSPVTHSDCSYKGASCWTRTAVRTLPQPPERRIFPGLRNSPVFHFDFRKSDDGTIQEMHTPCQSSGQRQSQFDVVVA
jgi:hypothetical protein